MKNKKILCTIMCICILLLSTPLKTNAEEYDPRYKPLGCSEEFASTEYYESLWASKEIFADIPIMERVAAIALSQQGYNNYSLIGTDISSARNSGNLWTGKTLRNNSEITGNTEYTRWAQSYIMGLSGLPLYYDIDWCAIFVSWCLYQAGYYTDTKYAKYYYSYCADPRIEQNSSDWETSFNLDQSKVWYTPKAQRKISAYAGWNNYVHKNVDALDIPYRQGGLLFFTWDGSGNFFDHIAIVIDYDPDTHIIQYISGNDDGVTLIRSLNLLETGPYKKKPVMQHSERIMAYAEYDEINLPEKKEITADSTYFTRDINDQFSISIHTNSSSDTVSLKLYGDVLANNGDYGLSVRAGDVIIPPEIFQKTGVGEHNIQVVLSDGVFNITLNITDNYTPEPSYEPEPSYIPEPSYEPEPSYVPEPSYEPEPSYVPEPSYEPEPSYIPEPSKAEESSLPDTKTKVPEIKIIKAEPDICTWEKGSDKSLSFHTDSSSDTVKINVSGLNVSPDIGELTLDNGNVTLNSSLLEKVLKSGNNYISLTFDDGFSNVVVNVKEKPTKIMVTPVSSVWYIDSTDGLVFKSLSKSNNVKITSMTNSAVKVMDIKNGMIELDSKTLSGLLKEGENTLTLRFTDGTGEIRIKAEHKPISEPEQSEKETLSENLEDLTEQDTGISIPPFIFVITGTAVLITTAIILFIRKKFKK